MLGSRLGERFCLKKQGGEQWRKTIAVDFWPLHLYTQVHTHAYPTHQQGKVSLVIVIPIPCLFACFFKAVDQIHGFIDAKHASCRVHPKSCGLHMSVQREC